MSRAKAALYTVGLLLVSLVGCASMGRFGGLGGDAAEDAAATLSLVKVASEGHIFYYTTVSLTTRTLQDYLRSLGLSATVTEEAGDVVRIASATPNGAHFSLVIRQLSAAEASGPAGRATKVTLEWEKNSGHQQDYALLAELEGQWRSKAQARNK